MKQNNNWQESETVEFKKSLAEKEDGGAAICAFANKSGGALYFGIEDNGLIIGIGHPNEKTIRDLAHFYRDKFQPILYPKITLENKEGKPVIKIEIDKSDTPYHTYKNVPYIRQATSNQQMQHDEYHRRRIRSQNINLDYSAKVVPGATIKDLSISGITELRSLLNRSTRINQNIDKLDDTQLLRNLQLMQGEGVTIAALILLGSEEGLAKYLPYVEIRYGYRMSDNEIRTQDLVIFKGGYFLYYNVLWEKINSRNLTINIPQGLFLTERKAFEEDTIREAVNNAIMHRDYQAAETIFIIQSPNLFEIKNPGGFIEGINLDNILTESKVRNKLIADILFRCEFVEQFGTGVNLMFKNQLTLGKNPPDFSKSDSYRVVLTLDSSIKDIEFAKYVIKIAEEKQKILSDEELLLLYKIKNKEKITFEATTALSKLGLIEKIGHGRWILAKKYYIDTKQKGTYSHKKGLDKETNKALLIRHLNDFPEGSKKEDLQKVLPYLTWIQIWRLLKTLRKEKKVIFTGSRRSKEGLYKLSSTK